MLYVNNVIFSDSKYAILFQHTTENSVGSKTALNERMEHSKRINYIGFEK